MRFVDSCSGEASALESPNGLSVEVQIEGLERNTPVFLNIKIGPENALDVADRSQVHRFKKLLFPKQSNLDPNKGSLSFKKELPRWKQAKKQNGDTPPFRRIWIAQVNWIQKGENRYHSDQASTYFFKTGSRFIKKSDKELHGEFVDRFYEKTGTPTASWSTPIEISSPYQFNSTTSGLKLSSESVWNSGSELVASSGFGIAPGGNLGAGGATGISPGLGNSALFFDDWRESIKNSTSFSMMRVWSVAPQQGGFFGTRTDFQRIPAREYAFLKNDISGSPVPWNRCGKWIVTRSGHLEVGFPQREFYIVPASHSGSREEAELYLNKGESIRRPLEPKYQIFNERDEATYFYPAN